MGTAAAASMEASLDETVLQMLRDRLVEPQMMASPHQVATTLRDLGRPVGDAQVLAYWEALRATPDVVEVQEFRTIVTLKAPFCDPVDMPYGPWSRDKFGALASLTTAMATHLDDERWTAVQSVRIDVRRTRVPEGS